MATQISRVVSVGGIEGKAGSTGVNLWPSKQLVEDPFSSSQIAGYGTALRMPPYSLEQLQFLSEVHPIHSAAIAQLVADVVANGPDWTSDDEDATDDAQTALLEKWFDSLTDDCTPLEVLQAVWHDYETLGWGTLEIVRDDQGVVRRIFHVPAHTVRAHADGILFAQIRQGRVVWFKKWGHDEGEFDSRTGAPIEPTVEVAGVTIPNPVRANELLVFRTPNSRSTWYGQPGYVASIGWILLGTSARDYNLLFFENHREARHIIVVTGLAENVHASVQEITQQMRAGLRDPHKNLILPLIGDCKVTIEKMSYPNNDAQFVKLLDVCDQNVVAGHRMPLDRLGILQRGRGGSSGQASNVVNRIYKDGVVSKRQAVLESRFNKFVRLEFPKAMLVLFNKKIQLTHHADFEDLDLTDEAADMTVAVGLVKIDLISINEGRDKTGFDPLDKFKHAEDMKDNEGNVIAKKGDDMFFTEYLAKFGVSPTQGNATIAPNMQGPKEGLDETLNSGIAKPPGATSDRNGVQKAADEILDRLDDIDGAIEEMIASASPSF